MAIEGYSVTGPVGLAVRCLGRRAEIRGHRLILDGRPATAKQVIEAARDSGRRAEPIAYPGVYWPAPPPPDEEGEAAAGVGAGEAGHG